MALILRCRSMALRLLLRPRLLRGMVLTHLRRLRYMALIRLLLRDMELTRHRLLRSIKVFQANMGSPALRRL